MLDVFSCPVSALMRLLHDLLGLVVDPTSGAARGGTVVLLVVVRLLLPRPAWHQLEAGRRAAALRPRLGALRTTHADDLAALRDALRRLQATEGAGVAGLLPLPVQLPVFVGLSHLLAGFTLAGAGGGNGVFPQDQVRAFATATVGGVPLSAAVRTPGADAGPARPRPGPARRPARGRAAAAGRGRRGPARRPARPPPAGSADDPLSTALRTAGDTTVWAALVAVLSGGLLVPVPLALVLYWGSTGPGPPPRPGC